VHCRKKKQQMEGGTQPEEFEDAGVLAADAFAFPAAGGYMGILPPAGMDDDAGASDDLGRAPLQPRRGGRRRRRPGGDEADEDETEAEPQEWQDVGAEDLVEFFRAMGPPQPQWRCFGCRYLCMEKGAKIADVELRKVFATMAAGIGVCCPMALAVEVSLLHDKYRNNTNKSRKPHEEKIPKWSPTTIYMHWAVHTNDPEVTQWLDMWRYKMEKFHIERNSMRQRSRFTGETRGNKDQGMLHMQYTRIWYATSAKDPRKLSYFNVGSMFDRQSVTNPGTIAMQDRPMYRFFGKGGNGGQKRRRVVPNARN
jgi:hypothetical protein